MAIEKLLIDLWGVNMNEVDTSDCTDVGDILSAVVTYLSELPTVDAVEVVRCKDCKHRYTNKHGEPCCEIWAHNRDTVVIDFDFCSYGKRKINV